MNHSQITVFIFVLEVRSSHIAPWEKDDKLRDPLLYIGLGVEIANEMPVKQVNRDTWGM